MLRACSDQLAEVLTHVFNLGSCVTCLKSTFIVLVPKHSTPACLKDCSPVALMMKFFEQLVLAQLKESLPPTLDLYQFAYCRKKAFSSAFNIVIPSKLTTNLGNLGISTLVSSWILDFLTSRPQLVRSGHSYSITITLNSSVPQGCVLSPFLYSISPRTANLFKALHHKVCR